MPHSDLPISLLRRMYRTMVLIRRFEEAVADRVTAGEIKTPCHLYIGQEAVATGVCSALDREDYVWGGHRSHGHYIAKGGDIRALMAEIFCRATGCSEGRGGSMHICAPEVGILGTVPLVAATIPLAAGAALASKLRNDRRVSVSFFGDGATEEGHFHETLNIAGLYRLPVLFVCENNFYSSHLHLSERRVCDNIDSAGQLHGVESVRVDGNDVLAVRDAATRAVDRARNGMGPTLIECRTFRWRGHVGPSWDMDVGIKRKDDLKQWIERDPIRLLREVLLAQGESPEEVDAVETECGDLIEDAVGFAKNSPEPDPRQLLQHVF
ncbi:thiamine pyrophosphate-dependent dehydrogenase E1 component subunit alpha [Candidatus Binatus sp.]|jgi:acetoin:2,6-dichlorophenolindophenol oxidoreductase subunit alpha|uniref:thiamine pyrophosphate-dependent dehydrogenase E1 component subunit alpha n=1 Tax=Candidatus Binatus sp. TaxID=2811406 RepID=UPI003BCCD087